MGFLGVLLLIFLWKRGFWGLEAGYGCFLPVDFGGFWGEKFA